MGANRGKGLGLLALVCGSLLALGALVPSPSAAAELSILGRFSGPDGEPLAGIEVELRSEESRAQIADGDNPRSTFSDSEGRFRFDGLEPGERTLIAYPAQGSGLVALHQVVPVRASSEGVRTIDLGLLVLERGRLVRGRVVDARGQSVAGAELTLFDDVFETWQGVATSGNDGSFRLPTRAVGAVLLEVRAPNHPRLTEELHIPTGGLPGLRIELEDGVAIRGRVVIPDQVPASGAEVVLASEDGELESMRTDSAGRFAFAAAPARVRTATVRSPGRPEQHFDLPSSEAELGRLRLELPAGTALVGRITGLDESELGEVELAVVQASRDRFVRAEAQPRADGSFRLDGLGPGLWRLNARLGDRRSSAELGIVPGQAEIRHDLHFETGEPFAGTLRWSGRPAAGFDITAVSVTGGQWRTTHTDEEGRFRFESLETGEWLLRITSERLGISHAWPISTPSPAEAELDLRPVRVEGRLLDAAGTPKGDAWVRLRAQGEAGAVVQSRGTTAGDGTFRLFVTFVGPAVLEVRGDDRTVSRNLEIPDTGLTGVELRLE